MRLKSATDQLESPDRDDSGKDKAAQSDAVGLSGRKAGSDSRVKSGMRRSGSGRSESCKRGARGTDETSHFVHFLKLQKNGRNCPGCAARDASRVFSPWERSGLRRLPGNDRQRKPILPVSADTETEIPKRRLEVVMTVEEKLDARAETIRHRHDALDFGRGTRLGGILPIEMAVIKYLDLDDKVRLFGALLFGHLRHSNVFRLEVGPTGFPVCKIETQSCGGPFRFVPCRLSPPRRGDYRLFCDCCEFKSNDIR